MLAGIVPLCFRARVLVWETGTTPTSQVGGGAPWLARRGDLVSGGSLVLPAFPVAHHEL